MTTFHPGGGGSSLTSAGNSIPCHAELVSASHNKEIPQQVRDDKSHFPRPQGRGIKGEGLLHRPDCKILKRVQDDKLVSEAHSKELNVLTSYRLNDFKKKAAFTLAEVLITLAIIGVVAAMTIPTLIANYQERAWNTSAQVFERKLTEALKTMNTQQSLAGYSNTLDFVNELSKHFKTTKICNNNDLLSCFEDKVMWGVGEEGPKEVDMTDIVSATNFGQENWGTELIGLQFANGTTGLVAYNPDCRQNPYSNEITGISCIAMLYDTDGFKNPNTSGKDLRGINVLSLDSNCIVKVNGKCLSEAQELETMDRSTCENIINSGKYGNRFSAWEMCGGCDRGGGCHRVSALEKCGGLTKMPSGSDMQALADILYKNGTIDKSLCSSLKFPNCTRWYNNVGFESFYVNNINGGHIRQVTFYYDRYSPPYDNSDAEYVMCVTN